MLTKNIITSAADTSRGDTLMYQTKIKTAQWWGIGGAFAHGHFTCASGVADANF